MSKFKETVRVIQLNREKPDNGEVVKEPFTFSQRCMVKIVINSNSKIQIGPNGEFLKWTVLNHLSLVLEGNTATFQLINETFLMTVAWNEDEGMPPMISRLKTESSNAIVGIVQYSFPGSLKKKDTKQTDSIEKVRIVSGSITHFGSTVTPFNSLLKKSSFSSSFSSSSSISKASVSNKSTISLSLIPGKNIGLKDDDVHSIERQQHLKKVNDRGQDFYISRLVEMSVDINNPYKLANFRDLRCDNTIIQNIQNLINTKSNTDTFCFSMGGTEINIADASRVIPRSTNQEPNLWLNDNIIHGYAEIEAQTDIAISSNIHIHPVHSSYFLYNAWRTDNLNEEASRMANQRKQKNIMSTKQLSIMVVNLYNTHWFFVVFYPSLKKIDILNSMATSNGTLNVLCLLLHAYLIAHSNIDHVFGETFNISDWEICTIRTDRYPQQENMNDCGAYTLKGIDYLIAGKHLSWSQDSMLMFRSQILLSLRLQNIFSLSNPGHDLLDVEAVLRLLDEQSNILNQRENDFNQNIAENEAAENVNAVNEYIRLQEKKNQKKIQ